MAESNCGRVVLVEVRKKKVKTTLKEVEDFLEKVETYQLLFPERQILPAIGGRLEKQSHFLKREG
ncbi:MAG: hypothetical protein KAI83_19020 [Thiomargarita sp.]|nr:hypothetical protein [Thiomargarita sp.]